jgi:hypothetical protein
LHKLTRSHTECAARLYRGRRAADTCDSESHMLLHVIWAFVEDAARECPTFSVSGVLLHWADQSPAQVRQGGFRWRGEAWEADVEVARMDRSTPAVRGVLRLSPSVWQTWVDRSLSPRSEAARQLLHAMEAAGWRPQLGVVTLRA